MHLHIFNLDRAAPAMEPERVLLGALPKAGSGPWKECMRQHHTSASQHLISRLNPSGRNKN